jgi:hypothetical protein
VHETAEELEEMQRLLDASAASAGAHLRSIVTDERRPTALELCEAMQGLCLLTVATVTADGRPLTGPVDGYLLHGSLWFSSSPDSFRMRHLARRPAVSATYLPGEELAVSVHGRAELWPFDSGEAAELRQAMLDHYVPLQGPAFAEWVENLEAVCARIVADKIFAFRAPS